MVDPRVLDAMLPYFSEKFGNPSSIHRYGQEAKVALENARETVAQLFAASPAEIVFTGSGTEAINFAIKGVVLHQIARGKDHIITSKAEHHAVLKTCEYLEMNGMHVTYLDVDRDARVDTVLLRQAITPRTSLITIMHANNEIGSVNPIRKIAEIASEQEIIFHSDTVQSCGKMEISCRSLGLDLANASAHKLHGPKGIGALFIRQGVELEQWCHGGLQERGRRAGTENVALAVGFAKATELYVREREHLSMLFTSLKQMLIEQLRRNIPHIIIHAENGESLPNILSVSFPSSHFTLNGETLLINLDLRGISVSSGSACTSGSIEPSHVLLAMGYDEQTADATIRFSFGKNTTEKEIRTTVNVLSEIVREK